MPFDATRVIAVNMFLSVHDWDGVEYYFYFISSISPSIMYTLWGLLYFIRMPSAAGNKKL